MVKKTCLKAVFIGFHQELDPATLKFRPGIDVIKDFFENFSPCIKSWVVFIMKFFFNFQNATTFTLLWKIF